VWKLLFQKQGLEPERCFIASHNANTCGATHVVRYIGFPQNNVGISNIDVYLQRRTTKQTARQNNGDTLVCVYCFGKSLVRSSVKTQPVIHLLTFSLQRGCSFWHASFLLDVMSLLSNFFIYINPPPQILRSVKRRVLQMALFCPPPHTQPN
jgi:hypothetical protein